MVIHGVDNTAVWRYTCLCGDKFAGEMQLQDHFDAWPSERVSEPAVGPQTPSGVSDRRPAVLKLKGAIARRAWLKSLTQLEWEQLGLSEKDLSYEVYLCNKAILDHPTVVSDE